MARILIVDDSEMNCEILVAYLDDLGHDLMVAESGERALQMARDQAPDLVLLDVMMPGLDGYETARRLKTAAGSDFLPIILVTALDDHTSRMKGLSAGTDEFLTKPVDRHELLLRMSNLLALRSRTIALAQRNLQLLELERFREEMTTLIVHDLKNPITVVQLNLEFLADTLQLDDDAASALHDARSGVKRTLRLVANLLDLERLETARIELQRAPTELGSLIAAVVERYTQLATARRVTVLASLTPLETLIDPDLVTRLVENLLDNSLRFTPRGGTIEVGIAVVDRMVELGVGNSGPAIPVAARETIFEKYGQSGAGTGRRSMNHGLGLYFCRLVAEAHGGRLRVEETAELPTLFTLSLPLLDEPRA